MDKSDTHSLFSGVCRGSDIVLCKKRFFLRNVFCKEHFSCKNISYFVPNLIITFA